MTYFSLVQQARERKKESEMSQYTFISYTYDMLTFENYMYCMYIVLKNKKTVPAWPWNIAEPRREWVQWIPASTVLSMQKYRRHSNSTSECVEQMTNDSIFGDVWESEKSVDVIVLIFPTSETKNIVVWGGAAEEGHVVILKKRHYLIIGLNFFF